MRIEVRSDNTVRICGYVNAVERESRPVMTPHGMVNELIESGVFKRALETGGNVTMMVDHNPNRVLSDTAGGTLKLREDAIGLRADTVFTDEKVLAAAKAGKIKGWSFGMKNVKDTIEERSGKLNLRRIKELMLDHVTLVIDQTPCYSATSVEMRAEGEEHIEQRAFDTEMELSIEEKRADVDYSKYEDRLKELEGE